MNTKMSSWLLLCVLFFVPVSLKGQSTAQLPEGPLSLRDAIEYGIENSYQLRRQKMEESAIRWQRKGIVGSGLPQISASGAFDYNAKQMVQILPGDFFGQPGTMVPVKFGTKYNTSLNVQVDQMIFRMSYLVGLRAASTTQEYYEMLSDVTEEQVILDISLNYYAVQQLRVGLETIEANQERLAKLSEILKSQVDNDVARRIDLDRVTVSLTSLISEREQLETQISQRLNYLKIAMGMPVHADLKLREETMEVTNPVLPVQNPASVLTSRSDLKLLNTQMKLNKLDLDNIRSGYYPSLQGYGTTNYAAQRNEFNFFDTDEPWFNAIIVGLRLNIPIFDGFQRKSEVQRAKIRIRQTELDIARSTDQALGDYDNAYAQLRNSYSLVDIQRENVVLAERVYEQSNQLYLEGVGTLADLLDAELALRQARLTYTNQLIQAKTADIQLHFAQGTIQTLRSNP